jgi:TldD protein
VPLAEKVEHLLALNEVALRNPSVSFVSSSLHFVKIEQTSATTEGTIATQTIVRTNPGMNVTAVSPDRTDFQTRSAAVSPAGRGWEYVLDWMSTEAAERWAAEAAEKLVAASGCGERGTGPLRPDPAPVASVAHDPRIDRASDRAGSGPRV